MAPRTRKLLKLVQTAGVVSLCIGAIGFGAGSASGMDMSSAARWILLGGALYAAGRFLLWYLDDKH